MHTNIKYVGTGRRVARSTLQLTGAQAVLYLSGYLITVILARKFGPSNYGIYGLILSVLVWTEQIGRLGIPTAVEKIIPENEGQASVVEHTGESLLLTIYLLIFVAFWLTAPLLARLFHISNGTMLFRLAAFDLPLCGMYFAFLSVLAGSRKFAVVSIGRIIYCLTKLVGILAVIMMGLSIPKALLVNILATASGLLFLSFKVSLKNFYPSYDTIAPIVHLAFPVALYLFGLQVLYNLDLWCLRIIETDKHGVIGIYIAALNVSKITLIGSSVAAGVILPFVSFALAKQDAALVQRYVQGAARLLWVTLLPVCVIFSVNSEELITFIYSDDYSSGATFLSLLILGYGLYNFLTLFCVLLTAYGRPFLSAATVLCLIPLFLFLNIILIPRFGGIGAAASVLVISIPGVLITGILCYKKYGPLITKSTFVKVILSTAVAAILSIELTAVGHLLILKYAGVFGVFILILAILGELRLEDIQPFMLWRREQS